MTILVLSSTLKVTESNIESEIITLASYAFPKTPESSKNHVFTKSLMHWKIEGRDIKSGTSAFHRH